MKIMIEVEVPDDFDPVEEAREVQRAAQEWVDAQYRDYRDGMDYGIEDVIDPEGRL